MKIGIISALESEQTHLIKNESSRQTIGGVDYVSAPLEGVECMFALSGIGKTNSAMITTILIEKFGCTDIIFSGVAGGIDNRLNVGDVVVSTDVYCVDYGRHTKGEMTVYQPGGDPFPGADETHGYAINKLYRDKVEFPAIDDLKPVLGHAPVIQWGKVLTADIFMNCGETRKELFTKYEAQAFEMEGASVAQVATAFGVNWILVRALSDLAGEDSNINFEEFLSSTTYNASVVARKIVQCLTQ